MAKYLYRFWFPMVGYHGSAFGKLCDKCQDAIEKRINDGYVLPTKIAIDTSIGISFNFGFSFKEWKPCKNCQEKIKQFLDSANFLTFSGKPIELWRSKREEEVEA